MFFQACLRSDDWLNQCKIFHFSSLLKSSLFVPLYNDEVPPDKIGWMSLWTSLLFVATIVSYIINTNQQSCLYGQRHHLDRARPNCRLWYLHLVSVVVLGFADLLADQDHSKPMHCFIIILQIALLSLPNAYKTALIHVPSFLTTTDYLSILVYSALNTTVLQNSLQEKRRARSRHDELINV